MPPVFGPVSPSPIRLKSCAGASGTTRRPSASAKIETSSPIEQLLDHDRPGEDAAAPQALVELLDGLADEDALARRQPVDLDDARRARRPRASPPSEHSAAASTALAKLFEPSIRAAARPGPKTATPFRRSSSATPATSGASGPITARSTSRLRASPSRLSPSSARTGWQSPRRAIPGLPGCGVQRVQPGSLGELPGERMLAPARPDEEHLHGGRVYSPRLPGGRPRPALTGSAATRSSASTTAGSNCVPAQRRSSASASSAGGRRGRAGRW